MLVHPSLAQNAATIPANVEDICCKLCHIPIHAYEKKGNALKVAKNLKNQWGM
jgi:hypothetical protein